MTWPLTRTGSAALVLIAALCRTARGGDDFASTQPATQRSPMVVGATPLIAALLDHDAVAASDLILSGADPNDPGQTGSPPLYWASDDRPGMFQMLKLLVHHGAGVNPHCRGGFSPLHEAVMCGSPDEVEFLLASGAEVGAKEQLAGETPLHVAAWRTARDEKERKLKARIVDILLAYGANVNATTVKGKTPLDSAASEGYVDMEKLLRSRGGRMGTELMPATKPAGGVAKTGKSGDGQNGKL